MTTARAFECPTDSTPQTARERARKRKGRRGLCPAGFRVFRYKSSRTDVWLRTTAERAAVWSLLFRNLHVKALALAALAVAPLWCGCRATTEHTHLSAEASGFPPGATLVVVPFENLSNNRNAGLIATDLATSVLLAQGYFRVQEVGQVQEDEGVRFRRMETTPWERQVGANPVAAAAVGRACDVDCVLTGSVGEYGFVDGFGETATVGISVRLVDSASAQVLWSGSLSRRVGSVAFSEESAHRLAHQVLGDLLGDMETDLRGLNE